METNYSSIVPATKLRILREVAVELGADFSIVGGAVRDSLLGKRVFRDVDLSMDGKWEGLPEEFARRCNGSFFWLDVERRQARVVVPGPEGPRIFDFTPRVGGSLTEDLASRDFTINAIALVPTSGGFQVFDALNGVDDLRNGIIRTPSPRVLDADPLRLLRAFRFAATLGFEIDDATLAAIADRAHLAGNPAPERIRDELFRLLAAAAAAPALAEMATVGLLAVILPSLADAPAVQLTAVGKMEETLAELPSLLMGRERELRDDLAAETEADVSHGALLKFALFFTRDQWEEEARRLRLGKKSRIFLRRLEKAAESLATCSFQSDRAAFRFFRDHEPAALAALVRRLAEFPDEASQCRKLVDYHRECYDATAPELLLDGTAVMEILRVPAGPDVGTALEMLRRAEASGTVTNAAEARQYVAKNVLTTLPPVG